jgi:hypothetical protein
VNSDFSIPSQAHATGALYDVVAEGSPIVQVTLFVPLSQVEALYSYTATLHKRMRKVPAKPTVEPPSKAPKTTPTASVVNEIVNLTKASKCTKNRDVRAVLTAAVERHATSLAATTKALPHMVDHMKVGQTANMLKSYSSVVAVGSDDLDRQADRTDRKLDLIERTNKLKETELKMKAVELNLRHGENQLKNAPSEQDIKRKKLLERCKQPLSVRNFYCYNCTDRSTKELGVSKNYNEENYVQQFNDCKHEGCGDYDRKSLRVIAGFEKRFHDVGLDFWVDGPGVSVQPQPVRPPRPASSGPSGYRR